MTLQQPPRTYSLLLPEVITQHRAHQTEHSGTMALPFHCARAALVHQVSRYPSASSSGCAPRITSSTSPCALFHIATLIISFNQPFPIDSSTCALNLTRRQEKLRPGARSSKCKDDMRSASREWGTKSHRRGSSLQRGPNAHHHGRHPGDQHHHDHRRGHL